MPAQRQTNTQPYTACLAEVRDADGTIFRSCEVGAGGSVDWPQPIAGFSGWIAEPAPAATTEPADAETGDAEPAPAGKTRAKAATKGSDTQEATA